MSSMLSHLIISDARRENLKDPKGGFGWEKLFPVLPGALMKGLVQELTGDAWQRGGCMEPFAGVTHKSLLALQNDFRTPKMPHIF